MLSLSPHFWGEGFAVIKPSATATNDFLTQYNTNCIFGTIIVIISI